MAGGDVPPSKAEIARRIRALTDGKMLRSASGHFLITGTNRADNLVLAGWAEDVVTRLDKAVGIPSPFMSRVIQLLVRSGGNPRDGRLAVSEEVVPGRFVQRMTLWNHARIDVEVARRALCRLLLAGQLTATIGRARRAGQGDAGVRRAVPAWLAEGLAQYIDPNLRGPNMMDVTGRWEKGKLASIADFLAADGKVVKTANGEPKLDRSMSAVLVNWLMVQPGRRERFRRLIKSLDAGEQIDIRWLAADLGKGDSAGSVEEAWDYWLHGRRRVVYAPGVATPGAVATLKAQLLLYPGNCGIPLTVDFGGVTDLDGLVARRDEEWIPEFCRRKSISLKLLAVGRGEEFGAVVQGICRFLEALGRGKSEKELKTLLAEAEEALTEFEEKQGNGDAEDDSRRY